MCSMMSLLIPDELYFDAVWRKAPARHTPPDPPPVLTPSDVEFVLSGGLLCHPYLELVTAQGSVDPSCTAPGTAPATLSVEQTGPTGSDFPKPSPNRHWPLTHASSSPHSPPTSPTRCATASPISTLWARIGQHLRWVHTQQP